MPRLILLTLILSLVVVGCSSQPTPTSTPPPPTDTAVPPTETPTQVPPTPTMTATPQPPTPTPTPAPITGTISANAFVRALPATTAKSLGQVKKGDMVTLVGRTTDSSWFQINFPITQTTSNGWVLSKLIQSSVATDTIPALAAQGTPAATQVATITATPTKATLGTPNPVTTQAVTATKVATTTVTAKGTATPTTAAGAAPSGSLIYDTFEHGQYQLNRVRTNGSGLTLLFSGASEPALAPGGGLIAYHKRNGAGGQGLWEAALDGSNPKQLTASANAGYPTWSADGNNIAYNIYPNGALPNQIWRVTKDGTGATEIGLGVRPAWQPGGSATVMFDGCDGKGGNCYSLHTESAFQPDINNPTLVTGGTNAAWSPNGSQIAFQQTDANGINVYVANRDGSNKHAVTQDKGHNGDPIWSSDGQWIFYRSDKSGVWSIYAIRLDGSGDVKIVDAPVNSDNWDYEKMAIAP